MNKDLKTVFRKSKYMDDILLVFKDNDNPVSADDIYQIVKQRNKKIALSTVYRIIEKLAKNNIIHETIKDNDKSLYSLVEDEHKHYLICTECKKIIPIDICPFLEIEKGISKETGFNITGHRFEIYGVCPECHTVSK